MGGHDWPVTLHCGKVYKVIVNITIQNVINVRGFAPYITRGSVFIIVFVVYFTTVTLLTTEIVNFTNLVALSVKLWCKTCSENLLQL